MKILVLGHGRSGKDTFAEMLQKRTGLRLISSSLFCLDLIYPVLQHLFGYEKKAEAFNDRHNHRLLWKELISLYCAADKTALTKKMLEICDIYVGMRSDDEYQACKYLFDMIIWIDAGDRVPDKDPSMEIKQDPKSMITVFNVHGLAELERESYAVARLL